MLEIETKLLISFYSQIYGQTKQINQKLEQYHGQKNWPEWLAMAEFAINNKIHSATKIFLFIVNYSRKLRMRADIRRKEKVMKFAKRIKKVQEKARVALKKA